jgi:hypothetical protein
MIALLFPLAILFLIVGYAALAAYGRRFTPRDLLRVRGWVRLDDEPEPVERTWP